MPRNVRAALSPGDLDRRQGVDDPEARALRPRGREPGRPGDALPGALLRALLLPGAGHRSTTATPSTSPTARRPSGCRPWPRRRAWCSSCRCTRRTSTPTGIYYNTAAVIDADGKFLGKYRKTHIPHVKGFWEKFYFRPGNLGYPVFETAVGKVGVYICYDRHFPEGARALGLNGAEIVLIPSATSRGLSEYLWRVEQVSHAVANGYFVGTINRVGIENGDRRRRLLRPELLRRPAGPVHRRASAVPRRGAHRPRHGPRPDQPRSARPGSSTGIGDPTPTAT